MRFLTRPTLGLLVPALVLLLVHTALAQQTGPLPDPALLPFGLVDPMPLVQPQSSGVTIPPPIQPQISDWSRITYQRYVDEQWDIYVGDSTGVRAVVTAPGDDRFPALNRGGTRLAYSSARNGTSVDLYVANADGGGEELLVGDQFFTAFPAWSPDGSTIVYQGFVQGQYDIYAIDVQTRERRRLTAHAAFDGEPQWSPDGMQIVFTSSRDDGVFYLYVMNRDGSEQRRLNSIPYSLHPFWSPDQRRIGFDADVDSDGWQELAIMNANGSGQRMVYDPGPEATVFAGSWSPDGRMLGFTEIAVEFRNGNWVWDTGRLRQWDSLTNVVSDVVAGDREWYLNWQTTDTLPPESALERLDPYTRAGALPLQWQGRDRGRAGLQSFDLYTRADSGQPWELLLGPTMLEELVVQGQPGETASFLTRARDNAWNEEPQRDTLAQTTRFYNTAVAGLLTDNRGAPLEGVEVSLQPQPLFAMRSGAEGAFLGYTVIVQPPTLTISEPNFMPLPPTILPASSDFAREFYLAPADNVIRNGEFELGEGEALAEWEATGELATRGTTEAAAGSRAVQLGPGADGESGRAVLAQSVTIPAETAAPTLSFMARTAPDAPAGQVLQVVIAGVGVEQTERFALHGEWALYWLDAGRWRGQEVTVRFAVQQEAAGPRQVAWLDGVSLGSTGSDLWTAMSALPPRALPGQQVRLTLSYGNRGTVAAGATAVTLALPPGMSLRSAEPAGKFDGETWRWQRAEVGAGEQGVITVVVEIDLTAARADAPLRSDIDGARFEALTSNNSALLRIERGTQSFLPHVGKAALDLSYASGGPGFR